MNQTFQEMCKASNFLNTPLSTGLPVCGVEAESRDEAAEAGDEAAEAGEEATEAREDVTILVATRGSAEDRERGEEEEGTEGGYIGTGEEEG